MDSKTGKAKLPNKIRRVVPPLKKENASPSMAILITRVVIQSGTLKASWTKIAIPVAPPAATSCGAKNILMAIAIISKATIIRNPRKIGLWIGNLIVVLHNFIVIIIIL